VDRTLVEKPGVRRQLKWGNTQSIELDVHGSR
jgi:hypothetical protein